ARCLFLILTRHPLRDSLFPYTTLFRSALVGKYVELPDAYISVAESFKHAAAATECKVKVSYIASGAIKAHNVKEKLKGVHGILRSEEHTSELQSRFDLVCRLLLEKKK